MKHLPILIVGAGPSGLFMACELKRHGIRFRIIDKNAQPTQGSNATWIQTRTLEIFELLGMADQFIKSGHQCHAINFYEDDKSLTRISLDTIHSLFPYILMLPQRETERLLNKKLEESNMSVERSTELMDIKQTANGIISTIRLSDGSTETITSDWVIACDGANSTIRKKCQIPFLGNDIPEQFMVADAQMSSFLPTDEIHVFFGKGTTFPDKATIFSAFPWGSKNYRLTANLYAETPRQTFHQHEIKEIVAERTYGNFIVEKVEWISPFWIHSKIVNHMQDHSIFLVGDAAHIHSPAGGQGMNSGLQDAFNLAWKLALVIKKKGKSSLLESYNLERHSIMKKIVDKTEKLTHMMIFDKHFFTKLHQFSKNKTEEKNAIDELTQINIQYQKSPIIDYQEKTPAHAPKQGERVPDVLIDHSKNLYQYFNDTYHHILLFSGLTKDRLEEMKMLQTKLNQTFPELIKVHLVSKEKHKLENLIWDEKLSLHKQFHVEDASIYVIRPDNIIAYFSKNLDSQPLENFLDRYLSEKF